MKEEFYVGYERHMPASLARFERIALIALAVLLLVLAAILVAGQSPFAGSKFEYGEYHRYEGVFLAWPVPTLVTKKSVFLVVLPGKHGAADLLRKYDGMRVSVEGALIDRGTDRMLEIRPDSLSAMGTAEPTAAPIELGEIELRGEIVDSKCFLGVMNPGNGKAHRDCAVRCISGGIPPALLARDEAGDARIILLTGRHGEPIGRAIVSYVAEPISVRGRLQRTVAGLSLAISADEIRRE